MSETTIDTAQTTDTADTKVAVGQRFKKTTEQMFKTYEEARAVFDGIAKDFKKRKNDKLRLRKRADGYAVVTYEKLKLKDGDA